MAGSIAARRVANRERLRFRDEFVCHKALDVIGDRAPIVDHYRGHRLNVELLQLLMRDTVAWVRVSANRVAAAVAVRSGRPTAAFPDQGVVRSGRPTAAFPDQGVVGRGAAGEAARTLQRDSGPARFRNQSS